jgi:shikimate dehydrogenase
MHEAAFAALGIDGWSYQRLPVPAELFAETVRALPAAGFVGANVTIPHKEAALGVANAASPSARAIGAANTLIFDADGRIEADNTDAPGLLAALPGRPAGRTALVLGAGGSARAAVWALLNAGSKEVMIWNRTLSRAQALARDLGARVVQEAEPADLLVNCTSVGLADPPGAPLKIGPVDADEIRGYRCVVDLVYGTTETALAFTARSLGVSVVDGLEVLVRQGALSFEQWTGRAAPLEAMRHGARGR